MAPPDDEAGTQGQQTPYRRGDLIAVRSASAGRRLVDCFNQSKAVRNPKGAGAALAVAHPNAATRSPLQDLKSIQIR
jgi:hypothetical protein